MSGIECLIYLSFIVMLKAAFFSIITFANYSESESELNIFTKVLSISFVPSIPITMILVTYALFAARLDVFYVEDGFGVWLLIIGFIDTIALIACPPKSWYSKFLLFIGRSIK